MNNIIGYFDDASATPAFDPGVNVACPFCLMPLDHPSTPIKTISLAEYDHEYRQLSLFYRCHKACYESASPNEVGELDAQILRRFRGRP